MNTAADILPRVCWSQKCIQ